jgi:tellurite resistance protein
MNALRRVPPNFFSISFGIAGLAVAWSLAGQIYRLPGWIGLALFAVAAAGWLALVMIYAGLALVDAASVARHLRDPALAPFFSLAAVVGMLLAIGLEARAHAAGVGLFGVCLAAATLFGGWTMGQLRSGVLDVQWLHSGYFLPTAAGGLIAAIVAAQAGLPQLGWICFGVGVLSWVVLGSVVLSRLLFRTRLPVPLIPTLAIEVAPPSLAGSAYFLLTGNRVDAVAYAIAGYTLLMVLVQVTLLPLYWRTPFTLGFWSFTFPWTAVVVYALHWIAVERPAAGAGLGAAALAAVTALVCAVAVRSIMALRAGQFLPAPPRAAAPGPH